MAIALQSRSIETTDSEEFSRCWFVLEQVKGRLKEVLYAFAAGLKAEEVAKELGMKKLTVDGYKTDLLNLCRNQWKDVQKIDFHFLHEKFFWLASANDEEPLERRLKHCKEVVEQATPCQKEVLRAFADGLKPGEVAKQLDITVKTVSSHETPLFKLCRDAWGLPSDYSLRYHFLREKFADYFKE